MRLLAISGSLRRASTNRAALEALARLAPEGASVDLYRDLATLPAFNPDDDEEGARPPEAVRALRELVAASDGIVIAAPEYAHGVPGALKNSLDWLVSSDAFAGKPIILIHCAPRAFHAQSALRETLATMDGRLIAEAFVTLPLPSRPTTAAEILADADLVGRLVEGWRRLLGALARQ